MPKLIDLTLTLSKGMRGVDYEDSKTLERDGWNARTLHLYSHAGTHMDAQKHFGAGKGTIDQTPLQKCMGWAWVVHLENIKDQAVMTVNDLGNIVNQFSAGESLLFSTRWSQHVHQPQHYRDHFPRIGKDLANWCVDREVKMVGVEAPSVADVNNMEELTLIHQILLKADITIVEGLTHLDQLTEEKVFFIAAPLKIKDGDGCPCRAFAMEGLNQDILLEL